jgi:hypothetical protein
MRMFFLGKPSPAQRGAMTHRRAEHCRANAPLHCAVLVDSRYLGHPQPRGMVRALGAAGCRVTFSEPQDGLLEIGLSRWLEGVDVIVARGRSTSLLTRLAAAEAAGVPTLNRRSAIAAVADKPHLITRLHAAGIAVPRSWIGTIEQVRRKIPAAAFPLVLRPVFGDTCRDVAVDTLAAFSGATWNEPGAIAQQRMPDPAREVTLYVIGERVWAVRRNATGRGEANEVTSLPVTQAWRDLAMRCGELFGLQLYGVDCINNRGALQVIDVTDFPDYDGVAEAHLLLARHVISHGSRRSRAVQTPAATRAPVAWPPHASQLPPRSLGVLPLQKDLK